MSLEKLVLDKKEVPGMEFIYYLVELDFCAKLGKISSAKQSSIPKVRAGNEKVGGLIFTTEIVHSSTTTRRVQERNQVVQVSTRRNLVDEIGRR
jgi:hypothetical protein